METKLKYLVEQLVYQVLKEELPEPEADEEDVFGKYLFGQSRKLPEPDTEDELYLEKTFEDFVLENTDGGLARFIPTLIKLKNEGKYAQYLQPPQGKVWRIISGLSTSAAADVLELREEELLELASAGEAIVSPETNFDYSSEFNGRMIASWTQDLESSDLESFVASYPGSVTILFESNTDNGEYLFNPNGMKKIVSDEVKIFLEAEQEVVSVGDVVINRAAFYAASEDDDDYLDEYDVYQQLIHVMLGSN